MRQRNEPPLERTARSADSRPMGLSLGHAAMLVVAILLAFLAIAGLAFLIPVP